MGTTDLYKMSGYVKFTTDMHFLLTGDVMSNTKSKKQAHTRNQQRFLNF